MAFFWVVEAVERLYGDGALMMEAVQTSETMVNLYKSTRRYNRDKSHLHTHRRENLKSHH
jgi:hypothetical protein